MLWFHIPHIQMLSLIDYVHQVFQLMGFCGGGGALQKKIITTFNRASISNVNCRIISPMHSHTRILRFIHVD